MPGAVRDYSKLPGWPAPMGADLAAAYASISETSLHENVKQGLFPQPIRTTAKRKAWRRTDLDAWLAAGGLGPWVDGRPTGDSPSDDLLMTG